MGLSLAMVAVSTFCVVLCISGNTAAAISTTTTATTASVPTWPDLSDNVSTPTNTTTTTTTTVKSVTTSPELNLWTYLPREWSKICSVDYDVDSEVDATISCHVTASDHAQWRLADLRTSLASLVESSGLEVNCCPIQMIESSSYLTLSVTSDQIFRQAQSMCCQFSC